MFPFLQSVFLWHETQFSSNFGAKLSLPYSFGETLNTPLEHCPVAVFLVFLHIFFWPLHGSTCSFYSSKELNIVLLVFE
jgi:hypothetical protein